MVLELNENTDLEALKGLLTKSKTYKKFDVKKLDAKKFCGALKTSEDGLKVQQQLRDEWNN